MNELKSKKKVSPGMLLAALTALVLATVCVIIITRTYSKPSAGKVVASQAKAVSTKPVVKTSAPAVATPVVAAKPVVAAAPVTAPVAAPTQIALHGKVTGVDLRDCAKVEVGSDGKVSHGAAYVSRRNGELTVHYKGCAKLVWTSPPTATTVASLEGGAK